MQRRSRPARRDDPEDQALQPASIRRGAEPGTEMRPDEAVDLQRLAGNQAVVSRIMVARDAGPGSVPAPPQPAAPAAAAPAPPAIDWIDGLPGAIQTQIDTFSNDILAKLPVAEVNKRLAQRTANRITFMNTMRWLFGSDAATQTHFGEIEPMDNDTSYPLWAHISTRERLLEAQADLKAQNSPMPQTDVALGLRGDHLHPQGLSAGWFTHATGFAIDWKAAALPHIKDPRLIQLFKTVTGGTPHFDLQKGVTQRLDLIEKMGQGKATASESQAFLDRIESEYNRLKADSDKFKTDLPETSLAPLREVEVARAAVSTARWRLGRLQANRAKKADVTAAADALTAAIATFDEKKKDAEAQLGKIFEPWTRLLDVEIAKIDKEAADKNVDLTQLMGTFGFKELRDKGAALRVKQGGLERSARRILAEIVEIQRQVQALAARVDAAKAWLAAPGTATLPAASTDWATDLDATRTRADAVVASLAAAKASLGAVLPGAVLEPKPVTALRPTPVSAAAVAALHTAVVRFPAKATASTDKVASVAKPLADLNAAVATNATTLAERTAYRESTVTTLGGGIDAGSRKKGEKAVADLIDEKIKWLNLKGAKEALQTNAEGFVFKAADVRDPAITQLLGMMSGTRGGGMFTPDAETGGEAEAKAGKWSDIHGFNLAFMKAMVSRGFELGVAWAGESDTMHFELVEGRRLLESGGTRALTAGANLRAQEAAASQP